MSSSIQHSATSNHKSPQHLCSVNIVVYHSPFSIAMIGFFLSPSLLCGLSSSSLTLLLLLLLLVLHDAANQRGRRNCWSLPGATVTADLVQLDTDSEGKKE